MLFQKQHSNFLSGYLKQHNQATLTIYDLVFIFEDNDPKFDAKVFMEKSGFKLGNITSVCAICGREPMCQKNGTAKYRWMQYTLEEVTKNDR